MRIFIRLWLNIIYNSISTLRKQSLLKIIFVLFCSVVFLAGEFFICYRAFLFLRDFPEVGSIILERLIYLFYFALFLMLIFSNALIAYTTIYTSRDTELLFSYPLAPSKIYLYKFIESLILSSWAFLVLLIPFMISYGMVNRADFRLYPLLILFFIPFLMITGSIGAGITMFLVRFISDRKFKIVVIFMAALIILGIYATARKVSFGESYETFEIFMLNKMLPNIHMSHSPFWPSYWMSEGILKASRREFKDASFYFLFLLSTAMFFVEILLRMSSRFYLPSWVVIRSRVREKLFMVNRGIIEKSRGILRFFGRDICGLVTKDMKLFWRDISQWSQFLIFFGLLGIYFLNIRNFSYNLLTPFWKNICAFLNLCATLLTLGSLGTRFIFPQISMEGNKFWIVGLSPVGLRKILYQKFWTSLVGCLVITEFLIITSNRMLGISGIMMYTSIWSTLIMNFALVGLSAGLGASFPDFKSGNPAKIVSGFGGTLSLILSIAYILLTISLIVLPFQLFLKGYISSDRDLEIVVWLSMAVVTAGGLCLCILPLLYGEKRLAEMEF